MKQNKPTRREKLMSSIAIQEEELKRFMKTKRTGAVEAYQKSISALKRDLAAMKD